MKKVVSTVAVLILGAVTLLSAAELNTLRKAPELEFTVPGQGPKLLSQYRGKVVSLEFIFTTCPHCQAWSKIMTKFQQELGPEGFQAIDVAVNDNADLLVENFSKEQGVNFPVGWVVRDQMISFMGFKSAYFVVPQMVLIDRKGFIHYQTPATESKDWDGLMKEDVVKQHIKELLSSQGVSASRGGATTGRVALAKKSS